jgi:uncharacterized circularly permuted ATP-grasp superfamily protein
VISQRSPLAAYDPTAFWDEMFSAPGVVRPHYAALARRLETLSAQEVTRRQRAADLSFQARGITFAVNQDPSGLEKIMPFDLVPRIILAEEWERIERGLEQRVRALNLFLHDVYHDQKILTSGLIPPELVLGARGYRREVRSVEPPLGVYTHVVGSDLVRDHKGDFYVLEDNLRVPSGVSYVVENRRVLKRVWPQIFADYPIRPVEGYPQDLLTVLREIAPPIADAATVVLLTPGVHNSAFFEHAFLAKAMGIEMVQGSDLFVDDATVYMRTTSGRRRVDVIYRRVDDDFIDPLAFRRDSFLGVPGLLATYRMGRVSLANALGTGVADDKAIYAYVPTIIKYYLGEDEIIPNVKTYIAADPTEQGRRAVLNLGHSIGHAIEVATEYKAFAHGEAVGIGLLSALWLSAQSEGLDPGVEPEVRALLRRHGLPVTARNVSPTAIIDAMAHDKKARAGRVRFALLEGVGSPVWGRDPGDDLIEAAVARAVAKRT